LSPTGYKCLVANNDSGDESDEEEEYEDDITDETKSTSSQGASSYTVLHASTYNDDREYETDDVKQKELHQLYGRFNKEDKVLLLKLLRMNKEQGETLLKMEETLIKTNNAWRRRPKNMS
jgi:Icc-related predicted phosphoesterase